MGLTVDLHRANTPKVLGGVAPGPTPEHQRRSGTLAFDTSYPTGGESLVAGDLNLDVLHCIIIDPMAGYIFEYDYTNAKVLVLVQDADAGADSGLIEAANGADLAAALPTVHFRAIGSVTVDHELS